MQDFYQKNLEALYEVNRELHSRLVNLQENSRFEVFVGKDGEDINILDTKASLPIYLEPVSETKLRQNELASMYRYPFLSFFGLGNGLLFGKLLQNQSFKHLIIFEPEIEIIFIALHFSDFSEAFKTLRIILVHTDDFDSSLAMTITRLPDLAMYLKLFQLEITANYYGSYTMTIEKINDIMIKAIVQAVSSHGNDLKDALIGLDHFLANSEIMVRNHPFQEVLKQKSTSLAVTVATGPSLTKQLPLLKEIQDFVTIICVDASLPILEKWDIVPDIVTSLERVVATSKFFKKTSEEFQKEVGCFVLSALQHKEVLDSVKGEKAVVMRPFGYMIAFDLHPFGYAGIGMSAANLAYEMAYFMGFERVALLGQDLAYSKDESATHASEHIFGAKEKGIGKRMESEEKLYVPAWGGDGEVRTNRIWTLFYNFFVQNISEARARMETIDATEGGWHIDGAIDMAFSEVVQRYVDRQTPKRRLSFVDPDQSQLDGDLAKIKATKAEMLDTSHKMLAKLKSLQDEVIALTNKLEKMTEAEQKRATKLKDLQVVANKIGALKNELDDKRMKEFFWETIRAMVVNLELDIARIAVKIPKDDDELKLINIEFIFAHKMWLFSVHGAISEQVKVVEKYL